MKRGWEKPPFIVVALTAAVIGASAGFLAYAILRVRDAAGGIQALREAHLNSLLIEARLSKPRSDDARLGLHGGVFVTRENLSEVRRFLDGLQPGAAVRSVEFDLDAAQEIEAAGMSLVPFTIDVAGPFPAVAAYLSGLDRAPWLLVTDEVRIVPETDDRGRTSTKAAIEGYAYWK